MLAVVLAAPSASRAQGAPEPTGIWLTQAGDAKIHVSKCGAGICGTIVWLKAPIDSTTGRPQVDDKNRDPALARRPIIGLTLFKGMKPVAERKWSGRIYNADDGKTYSSDITLASSRKLEVRGCVMAVLCGGETWTKLVGVAEAD